MSLYLRLRTAFQPLLPSSFIMAAVGPRGALGLAACVPFSGLAEPAMRSSALVFSASGSSELGPIHFHRAISPPGKTDRKELLHEDGATVDVVTGTLLGRWKHEAVN